MSMNISQIKLSQISYYTPNMGCVHKEHFLEQAQIHKFRVSFPLWYLPARCVAAGNAIHGTLHKLIINARRMPLVAEG